LQSPREAEMLRSMRANSVTGRPKTRTRARGAMAATVAAIASLALAPGVADAADEPCRDFPSVPSSAVVGQPVQYTVTASSAFARLDVTLRWSDGPDDGPVSLQPGQQHTFAHTYTSTGSYSVFISSQGPLAAGGFCSAFEHFVGTVSVTAGASPPPPPPAPSGGQTPDLPQMLQQENACGVSLATPIGARGGAGFVALPERIVGADICPQRLRARGWNRPGRIPVLEPGDEATVASPELSPSQRSATVTLGTTAGDVVVTLSDEDARYRRFGRTACLLVAGRLARQDLISSGILAPNAKAMMDAGNFLALSAIGKYLTACLAFVDDSLVGSARPVALPLPSTGGRHARAAAAGACPVSRVPVRLSASQATGLLHIDAKRAGAPPPTLRVTCRTTAAGIQVRVTPRRPGVSLRKLVGPRLKVGLVRLLTSRQTAGPTIAFRR
jgi:hypothetical protein